MSKNNKDIYVLGLVYSHDSSACLLKNGIPVVAIQKERLTGIKHDGSESNINLDECIKYCLESEKITINDIALVIENSPSKMLCKYKDNVFNISTEKRLLDSYKKGKITQVSHHLAHAYCAYGASPFDECAALVIDGAGNYMYELNDNLTGAVIFPTRVDASFIECESMYLFVDGKCKTVRKNFGNNYMINERGIGHFYAMISMLVFGSNQFSGKLMGLAALGENKIKEKLAKILPNGKLEYSRDIIKKIKFSVKLDDGRKHAKWYAYRHVAFLIQKETEKLVLSLASWLYKKTKIENLVYAGGVALNCPANTQIIKKSGFKNVFFAPPATDCGVSMGCAFYGYLAILKKKKINFEYSDYLGKNYTSREILSTLQRFKDDIVFDYTDNICLESARLIHADKIIGWFQGRSEFGPRALGNRSILCTPTSLKLKDFLNSAVKQRESFRPFAPSVLEDEARKYFNITHSPYMMLNAIVKKDMAKSIMGVVHADGSVRIQTVSEKQNSRYFKLIREYFELTGIPMVLNTSFNVAGQPIVETPLNAIECFLGADIDYLCIGDYVVRKKKNNRNMIKSMKNKNTSHNSNIKQAENRNFL